MMMGTVSPASAIFLTLLAVWAVCLTILIICFKQVNAMVGSWTPTIELFLTCYLQARVMWATRHPPAASEAPTV